MQELLQKMGGGVYAEGGVFAGFYGICKKNIFIGAHDYRLILLRLVQA